MSSPLDNLAGPDGALRKERPDAAEFAALVRSGTVRLEDASSKELSIESRFDLAYNAAHSLSLAALRHAGYRAKNRYVVFQTLPHTLGLGQTYGASWTNATSSGIRVNTKASFTWTSALSTISSWRRRPSQPR